MKLSQKFLIVILGPTASGKSKLAVKLAKKLAPHQTCSGAGFNGAEIISADSRQVYKGLDIGTGKITKKEMEGIPHYCLDCVSPKKVYTVTDFKKCAQEAIEKILEKGKIPIICGGTGFYIQAIVEDLNLPKVPPNWKLRKKLEKKNKKELLEILKKLDPKRAKTIDANNPRRLIRAIEIAKTLGKVPPLTKRKKYKVLKIGIDLPKEKLKEKIKKRLITRLKKGMIKEVKNLHQKGISWKRLYNLGLEYRWISLYLRKKISKKEMVEKLLKEIWQFAKRQLTWFKKDKEIHWIKNYKEAEKLVKKFLGDKNS